MKLIFLAMKVIYQRLQPSYPLQQLRIKIIRWLLDSHASSSMRVKKIPQATKSKLREKTLDSLRRLADPWKPEEDRERKKEGHVNIFCILKHLVVTAILFGVCIICGDHLYISSLTLLCRHKNSAKRHKHNPRISRMHWQKQCIY